MHGNECPVPRHQRARPGADAAARHPERGRGDLLLRFGRARWPRDGAKAYFLDRARLERLRRKLDGARFRTLEKSLRGSYVVVGRDGQVITVAHFARRRFN